MNYLTLTVIKKHLNIDVDFTEDDTYLEALGTAVEDVVSKYIDYPLEQLEDSEGNLPKALVFAMLLWIGTIYAVRESVSSVNYNTIPNSFEMLCDLYRDYKLQSEK